MKQPFDKDTAGLAVVSGEYPEYVKALEGLGVKTIATTADERLPNPVRYHADMQMCVLGEKRTFVLKSSKLQETLVRWGIDPVETEAAPENSYPKDVLCNAFMLGTFLVCNPQTLDKRILAEAKDVEISITPVKQGYAACAAAVVSSAAIITADEGMEKALKEKGVDVLLISPGNVLLPGYDTGFIGGCCGLISKREMVFCGSLTHHPDGNRIKSFIAHHGVRTIELSHRPLLDIGGIKVLREKRSID